MVGVSGIILLQDIGIIIIAATVLAYIAKLLRQPLILAYIVAGIFIGPSVFGVITNRDIIAILAELGIAFLLFIIGLELDFRKVKDVGRVAIGCGSGQILITFISGFLLAKVLGFAQLESFYIAFALTISSTMVVIKLLSDKHELDTLHGRISLGILLVQDILTIVVLAVITSIGSFTLQFFPMLIVEGIIKGGGLILIAIITSRFILPPILRFSAKSTELLFLTALSLCFVFVAISFILGFSIAIGAFLAGVTLASFPYNIGIVSRVRSLRDFFATIFLVSLGMQVPLTIPLLKPTIVFSIFVLLGDAIIMMFIASLFGYGKRTSFLTALSVAQISEFSLILASQGLLLGHISQEVFSLIAFIAVVTITASSYLIMHGDSIYRMLSPFLGIFEHLSRRKDMEIMPKLLENHTILCGCDRMGRVIVKTMQKIKKKFIVIDYNPDIVKQLIEQGIPCIYGDVEDIEILERANLKNAEILISTIPNREDNLLLIKEACSLNPKMHIFITADYPDDALEFYDAGADYVIVPKILGGEKISEFLDVYKCDKECIRGMKKRQILQLEKMKAESMLSTYKQ